eukprot:12024432-Prorocentrum_lima.AAC.1
MTSSLVGSEMCIRDRICTSLKGRLRLPVGRTRIVGCRTCKQCGLCTYCLLYTSDAATICSV